MEEAASARRARLKALRDRADADAAVASAPGPSVSSGTTTLTNPLADDDASASGRVPHASASRGFYSDPMSQYERPRVADRVLAAGPTRGSPHRRRVRAAGVERRDGNHPRRPHGSPTPAVRTRGVATPAPTTQSSRGSHRPRLPSVLAAADSRPLHHCPSGRIPRPRRGAPGRAGGSGGSTGGDGNASGEVVTEGAVGVEARGWRRIIPNPWLKIRGDT